MEHVNTSINEIVVMYRSAEKVIRPTVPTDVSGHHVMISFSVSRCDEALCEKAIQLLVEDVLTCSRTRSCIPLE